MSNAPIVLWFMGTMTLAAPLVLAALGGLISERSGVVNISLEGCMLGAACASAIVGVATQSAVLGLCAGVVASILLSTVHGLLTQAYSIDHIVSGMAINVFAFGATNFAARASVGSLSEKAPTLPVQVFWTTALASVVLVSFALVKTRFGLRLRAVGGDPESSRLAGISVLRVRTMALLATGACAGLSGALIMTNAQGFSDGMTAGRGFIALAALILGGWRPWATFAACLLFGAVSALQFQFQGTRFLGSEVPREVWTALPYVVTLCALAGLLGRNRAPSGLGKP